ncbi:acylneuraminate cytidylyltransferase [Microbacterium aquilitoris]|uniref:acylneuraminate cytidylyltransferase n=1 Tax=Microbacterium aquilitoris TaxID=3067307 RepID=UPI0028920F10|nr:acylneuraminate cytidylyltransferase [Microbacterium sp. KSW2-22]MDT3345237.1 acylneuraminate cytidylyltransferase [Microbacterium sp. KSW2-22]
MTVAGTVETIAIIPARGGSKGVPGKNVARVGGVPLVVRAVRAAHASGAVDLVVVSTDDEAIAAAARAAGARVIARPADISGDTASSESALLHALDVLADDGIAPRVTAFLQATSPFIPADTLGTGIAAVRSGSADSAFSARESYEFVWRRDADGAASALGHDAAHRPRRQEREPHYVETGAFYVFTTDGFRRARHRFFGRTEIVEVPEATSIEIDDPAQLRTAQALAHLVAPAEPIAATVVVTDFDGVHTDDSAWVDAAGTEHVRVSRSDGMGVALLRRAGVPMLILSTEQNAVVRARAEKLQVEVVHGVADKASVLRQWADDRGVDLAETAYLGNDVNDLAAMALVGWPIAVADAQPEVVAAARIVLMRRGGDGAVRELADRILAAR